MKVKFRLCIALCAAIGTIMFAEAHAETYVYDVHGRLIQVTYPDGRIVTYSYDAAGNRTAVSRISP